MSEMIFISNKVPKPPKYRIKKTGELTTEGDYTPFYRLQEKKSFLGISFWKTIASSWIELECRKSMTDFIERKKKFVQPKEKITAYFDAEGSPTIP